MLSKKMKNSLRNLLAFVFLFAMGYFFLMGSQTQTPEEFDQEFIAKYDACILRAKNRCGEGMSQMACNDFATNRCETFLGTQADPIIK
tara:strand:- start:13 stop:276 length:264 start_codon:yes stop_codon:yes gene_type:complete